jgi:hypothetical protein
MVFTQHTLDIIFQSHASVLIVPPAEALMMSRPLIRCLSVFIAIVVIIAFISCNSTESVLDEELGLTAWRVGSLTRLSLALHFFLIVFNLAIVNLSDVLNVLVFARDRLLLATLTYSSALGRNHVSHLHFVLVLLKHGLVQDRVLKAVVLGAWSESLSVESVVHCDLDVDTLMPNLALRILSLLLVSHACTFNENLLVFLQGCQQLSISGDGLFIVNYWHPCFVMILDLAQFEDD